MKEKDNASLIDYLEIVVKWQRFILRNVLIVTAIAIIVSFLLPQKFTATTTMLPPNLEQQSLLGIISPTLSGGLSGLSGISGILPGMASPSELFTAIMKSGRIKSAIVEKHGLKRAFNVKTTGEASGILETMTRIVISPEGIVTVSVTYGDKYLATDIANSYIEELDKFNTATAMTVGKRYRIFIEKRLKENIDTLARMEEKLRTFQEKHRTIALTTEIESAIQTIAEIKSQIIMLEVKKGALSSSSQFNNPYLYNINRELRELKKQLEKIEFGEQDTTKKAFGAGFAIPFSELPEVSLEFARLLRDVKVQEHIYRLLTQQYEQAKIMELKDTPTVQILDEASPPEKRSFPKRKVIVILVFLVSLIANIGLVFFLETLSEAKISKSAELMRWTTLYRQTKKDIISLIQYIKKPFKWKK